MERLNENVLEFLGPDGVHLSWQRPAKAPTVADFLKSGYLLRCYATVRKGMEVKERVLYEAAVCTSALPRHANTSR
jgi:hypothetical protein